MERFTREDQNDVVTPDESLEEAEPWVMGRDLSQPGVNSLPQPGEQSAKSGARVLLAGVAALASAVAVVFAGLMLFNERFTDPSWPLVLTVVALLVAAAALFGWWRQGADDPTVRRTFPR